MGRAHEFTMMSVSNGLIDSVEFRRTNDEIGIRIARRIICGKMVINCDEMSREQAKSLFVFIYALCN